MQCRFSFQNNFVKRHLKNSCPLLTRDEKKSVIRAIIYPLSPNVTAIKAISWNIYELFISLFATAVGSNMKKESFARQAD